MPIEALPGTRTDDAIALVAHPHDPRRNRAASGFYAALGYATDDVLVFSRRLG